MAHLEGVLNVEAMRPPTVDQAHVFNLDRMRALLAAMGDPHQAFRSVHVAGSKGKGSVCEMTAAALQACGYTVGLYTSPHLVDLRERIRINGEMIHPDAFCDALSAAVAAGTAASKKHGPVTWFELVTAAAFQHFAELAVDVAVVETGMGGRVDATNVITPMVTAVTAIQLEHKQFLGDTLEAIAKEKAGIFKPGVPAIVAPQPESVEAVFRGAAESVNAPVRFLQKDLDFSFRFESSPELGPHTRVCLSSSRGSYEHLPVPLKGEHQAVNCGIALAILDALKERDFHAPEGLVAEGLSRVRAGGRMEQIHQRPRVYVDGAHNPESIGALMKTIGANIKYDSMVVVFGCNADKDVPGMLQRLAGGADKVIFTRATGAQRSADPRDLLRKFTDISAKFAQLAPTLKDALQTAGRAVQRDDLIVVTGSFAMAGEAKSLFAEAEARRAGAAAPEIRTGQLARGAAPRRS